MEKNSATKSIHTGHRKRVKANVCKNGFSQLEDHKLLELLLFYSIPQADTNELAHVLLSEFGSLDELLKADVDRLLRVKGVGENTAVLLASVSEIFKRGSKLKIANKVKYVASKDFESLAVSHLSGETVEKVIIFCLDNSGKLKKATELSMGDDGSAYIDVRKAVQAVMDCNATKAVLAHNHPVGTPVPSIADIESTRSICVMFRKLGVSLADHIIVGEDNSTYSMYTDPEYRRMFY